MYEFWPKRFEMPTHVLFMKCKNCRRMKFRIGDSDYEFIYKTGYCRMCLIDMGYCFS